MSKWERVKVMPVGKRKYKVLEDYDTRYKGIIVPAGFVCDGASIPRVFWSIVGGPFSADHMTAAVVHDYLYGAGLTTRAEDDEVFLAIMRDHGAGLIKRRLMYHAVRGFGHWSKK